LRQRIASRMGLKKVGLKMGSELSGGNGQREKKGTGEEANKRTLLRAGMLSG